MSWGMVMLAVALGTAGLAQAGESTCEQIYRRATAEFEAATYVKPVATSSEDLLFKLAPLILELGGQAGRDHASFGALTVSNGVAAVNSSAPTVYFDSATAHINGKPRLQLVYVWLYQPAERDLLAQGVRITLDSSGSPVIWEVLRDTSGLRPVFAAHSLEEAAAKDYGQALAGRRYALEPARRAVPRVIVARVIEDGPMPMGPMVYVDSASRDIVTVLCRCMPPQFKRLAATRTYELAPLTSVRSLLQTPPLASKNVQRRTELFDSGDSSRAPVQELRLPSDW